jgi:hypothetical protein
MNGMGMGWDGMALVNVGKASLNVVRLFGGRGEWKMVEWSLGNYGGKMERWMERKGNCALVSSLIQSNPCKEEKQQKQIACQQSAKMHKYLCSFGRSSAFCPFIHPSTCVIAIIQYSIYNTVPIIT